MYKGKAANTFDVIAIGSGSSGGWAAKEFCEKGFKTLVLERGRMVEHIKDYPTTNKCSREFPHRNNLPATVGDDTEAPWKKNIDSRKAAGVQWIANLQKTEGAPRPFFAGLRVLLSFIPSRQPTQSYAAKIVFYPHRL